MLYNWFVVCVLFLSYLKVVRFNYVCSVWFDAVRTYIYGYRLCRKKLWLQLGTYRLPYIVAMMFVLWTWVILNMHRNRCVSSALIYLNALSASPSPTHDKKDMGQLHASILFTWILLLHSFWFSIISIYKSRSFIFFSIPVLQVIFGLPYPFLIKSPKIQFSILLVC